MPYDALVVSAHPDDAEVQMGGTIAKLVGDGLRVLLVDLCDGEPSDVAVAGERVAQARRAAAILGADRIFLDGQDRLLTDSLSLRLQVAQLIRQHRPPRSRRGRPAAQRGGVLRAARPLAAGPWRRAAGRHRAVERRAAVLPAVQDGAALGRDFAFAVDVSATYERKRAALAEYGSIFRVGEGDRLLTLYEAEDAYMGRLFAVAYAETFKSQSPLLVTSPTVFLPARSTPERSETSTPYAHPTLARHLPPAPPTFWKAVLMGIVEICIHRMDASLPRYALLRYDRGCKQQRQTAGLRRQGMYALSGRNQTGAGHLQCQNQS